MQPLVGLNAAAASSNPRRDARTDQHPEHERDTCHRDLSEDDHDARRPFLLADPVNVAAESGEAPVAGLRAEAVLIEEVTDANWRRW
jgi:hypothetical protein